MFARAGSSISVCFSVAYDCCQVSFLVAGKHRHMLLNGAAALVYQAVQTC